MYASLRKISAQELTELQATPGLAARLMDPDDDMFGWADWWPDGPVLDLEKTWHVLHFLLTGKEWNAEPPLGDAILGGTDVGEDLGSGPARLLTPRQVAEVAQALEKVDEAKLWSRFDISAFEAAKIYPGAWVQPVEPPSKRGGLLFRRRAQERQEIGEARAKDLTEFTALAKDRFRALVQFYRETAAANGAILVLIG